VAKLIRALNLVDIAASACPPTPILAEARRLFLVLLHAEKPDSQSARVVKGLIRLRARIAKGLPKSPQARYEIREYFTQWLSPALASELSLTPAVRHPASLDSATAAIPTQSTDQQQSSRVEDPQVTAASDLIGSTEKRSPTGVAGSRPRRRCAAAPPGWVYLSDVERVFSCKIPASTLHYLKSRLRSGEHQKANGQVLVNEAAMRALLVKKGRIKA
jgi:hypothetical protein